jgi:AraC-like DNA-binding protein
MQKRIKHFLNRPFSPFLTYKKGRNYYFRMVVIIALLTIIKPVEFINWHEYHEYHQSLISAYYIFLFFGMYALLHYMLKFIFPRYYDTDTWTLKKQFQVLLVFFPVLTGGNCLYADFAVPEFELTLDTFLDILLYNCTLSFISIPTLGFIVDKKLIPAQSVEVVKLIESAMDIEHFEPEQVIESTQTIEPTLSAELKENTKSKLHLTEEEERNILHNLHHVMKTEQLYLSKNCHEQQVASFTNISVHHISYVINTFTPYRFNDFVNKYRVEHACRILQNGPDKNLTIEGVGYECGFRSKASFYAAFRKFTGQTPAAYLADLKSKGVTPSDALTKENI